MTSARLFPGGGARARHARVLLVCVALTAGCTEPNRLYNRGAMVVDSGAAGTGAGGGDGGAGAAGAGGGAAGGAGGGSGGTGPPPADAGMTTPGNDAGAAPDTGLPVVGSPPERCGTDSVDPSGITGAAGIAVGPEGVIYFALDSGNRSYVGRLAPGQAAQPSWFPLPSGSQPRTLRLDSSRGLLFVAASGSGTVYGVAYNSSPVRVATSQGGLPGAHGLAVADDGAVFVSTSDGFVYRAVLDVGLPGNARATATPIFPAGQRPLGVAFGPAGDLFVASSGGRIKRFRVQGQTLVDGVDHGQFAGSGNDLAVDVQGRLYVADAAGTAPKSLAIVAPDGTVTTAGVTGLLSGLAFGRGALPCQDLFISDGGGAARRYGAPAAGLRTP